MRDALLDAIITDLDETIARETHTLIDAPTEKRAGHIKGLMDAAKVIRSHVERHNKDLRPGAKQEV